MKKRLGIVLSLLLGIALVFSLSACGWWSTDTNFPYDVAVENGYTGTEAEWLSEQESAATIYLRLYREAQEVDGYEGSYLEFLQALGISGDDTPYIQRALLSVVSIVASYSGSMGGSAGAGVILPYGFDRANGNAYILTNYHVVFDSTNRIRYGQISVYLYGNETADGEISATFYGGAMQYDLAVLRVQNSAILKGSAAMSAPIGDSDSVRAGEEVYAIGNPENENISVTKGVVSVEYETIYVNAFNGSGYMTLPEIRTDATINHGNSGGGLFNAMGELVGITNARMEEDGVESFGYAIPANFAVSLAKNVLENSGKCSVANLGIEVAVGSSKAVYDEALGRTHVEEKLVVADRTIGVGTSVGIQRRDTLISAVLVRGGQTVETVQFTRIGKYESFMLRVRQGDTVRLTISRDNSVTELNISFSASSAFKTVS